MVFVEKQKKLAESLKANLKRLKVYSSSQVLNANAFSIDFDNLPYKFDILFIDPPFRENLIQRSLDFVKSSNLLTPMRPRLYLISIIVAIVVSLLTYGKLDIFQETQINILNKELILNSEIVISLIVLTTLLFVLVIGLIDKLITTKKPKKIVKKED